MRRMANHAIFPHPIPVREAALGLLRRAPLVMGVVLSICSTEASAQCSETRGLVLSPMGAPRDLVGISQSRPLSHLSFAGGTFLGLSPASRIGEEAGCPRQAARLQLDVIAAIGLLDWVELGVDVPFVSPCADLRRVDGTEGLLTPLSLVGPRFTTKAGLPGLRRTAGASGLGASVTFALGLPASGGDVAREGVTYAPGLVVDYRFDTGALLALNAGARFRPTHQLSSTQRNVTVGLGAAFPLVRRHGLAALGTLASSASVSEFRDSSRPRPLEWLLGLRWYSASGLTFTVGAQGTSSSIATTGLFTSIIWVPRGSPEREATESAKLAYISGNKLRTLERIRFATDEATFLPESIPTLKAVAWLLHANPRLERVLVEGHTDSRATDAYDDRLSYSRAIAVAKFFIAHGVAAERLCPVGYGRRRRLPGNESRNEEEASGHHARLSPPLSALVG